jgi:hypothetical protein
MAFSSIGRMRAQSVRLIFVSFVLYACLPGPASAEVKEVTLRVCLRDESRTEITKATVQLRALPDGRVNNVALSLADKCYGEPFRIDPAKQYELKVEMSGQQQAPPPLVLSGASILANPRIDLEIKSAREPDPKKEAEPAGGTPTPANGNDPDPAEDNKWFIISTVTRLVRDYWLAGALFTVFLIGSIFLLKAGYRLSVYRLDKNPPTLRNELEWVLNGMLSPIAQNIQILKTQQDKIFENQQYISDLIERQRLDPGKAVSSPEVIPTNPIIVTSHLKPAAWQQDDNSMSFVRKPHLQEAAQSAYKNLVRGYATGALEPIYLNAEASSSPLDMLGNNNVHLEEVNNKQGTFILFKDTEQLGWVFPNPRLKFRQQALSPVFPGLTESQFGNDKENIQPVVVSRVDSNRWKIDPVG